MYGIAGFVEGFTGGVNMAHQWKDRKRDQNRQDKADAMEEEMNKRRLEILDLDINGRKKTAADQAFYEDTYSDAVDATNAALEGGRGLEGTGGPAGGPPGSPPAAPPVAGAPPLPGATSGLPPPSGILPIDQPPTPNYAAQGMPSPAALLAGSSQPSGPAAVTPPAGGSPVGGPMGGPVPPVAYVPPPQAPFDPMANAGIIRRADGTLVAPAPRGIIADELAAAGRETGVRYLRTPAEEAIIDGRKPTLEEVQAANGPFEGMAVDQAKETAARDAELTRAVADSDGPQTLKWRQEAQAKLLEQGYTTTDDWKTMTPPPAGPPTKAGADAEMKKLFPGTGFGGGKTDGGGGSADLSGKAPPTAPPVVKELADTAVDAMKATNSPAMEAASAAAGRGLPATEPGKTPTEETRKKYAGDFMDHYREVGAPMVYEALISKGEFAKAEAFRDFLDKDATKAGMENWAKAAFAASVGDMDTFSTEIMDAYDRLDYFPDGTTIVRDESVFTKDEQHNITGAKLTFRDEKTGNTWDQVFTDPNDLVRMGITLLAPDQAFEYYFKEQQAAADSARGLQTKEAEAEADRAKDTQKRIDDVAKMIYEKSADPLNPRVDAEGNPLPPMTYGEAMAQAKAEVMGPTEDPAAAGPPVARRP